jgi:hypothetical protein
MPIDEDMYSKNRSKDTLLSVLGCHYFGGNL